MKIAKLLVVLLLTSLAARAATITTTCAGLASAIGAAASGDTVVVSGGNCGGFSVSNGATVNGSGTTSASSVTLSGNSRVTGFSFSGANAVAINANLTATPRLDHNTFTSSAQVVFVNIYGIGRALIDHNAFTGGAASEMIHNLGSGAGDHSGWSNDLVPGGPDMVFVEDNTFTYPASGNPAYFWGSSALQAYYGARTVFRHNTLTMAQIDQHGTAGNIGARWWEIYANTFITVANANQSDYIVLRAGSGVVFGNTHSGPNGGAGNIQLVEEDSGYPASDQIGRGINQKLSPAYVWGNSSDMHVGGNSSNVVSGRDFFLSSTQPSSMTKAEAASDGNGTTYTYQPYQYPHPLQNSTAITVAPPSILSAPVGDHSVDISWVASISPNVTYNVKRSMSSGSGYAMLGNVSALTYHDATVLDGVTYYYVASAVDAMGNESANCAEVAAVIPGAPPPAGCQTVAANTWSNQAFAAQTGTFTVSFDATPSSATMDSVIGLSNGAASAFTSLAPIVWFSNTGTIQARNGANYTATASYRYAANTAYHVTMTVNLTAKTYSAWVHTGTASDTQIASNYTFRTEQAKVALLSDFAAFTNTTMPTISVCNFALGATIPPPPPPPPMPTVRMTCTKLVCTITQTNNPSGTQFPVSLTGPGGQSASAVAVAP